MVIKLSELQLKEVIVIDTGQRLGHIYDLEMDAYRGRITAIILLQRQKGGLFGKANEIIIYWEQIHRIGKDVILVNEIQLIEQPQEP